MIRNHSSLATAQIVVQLVLNDVLCKNIQATVQSFVNPKNSIEQGLSFKKDHHFFHSNGVVIHVYEDSNSNDIIIQRCEYRLEETRITIHNFNREFDRAANYIVDQLQKHFPKDC